MSIFQNEMFNKRDDEPIFLITVKDDNTMLVEPVPSYVKPVVPQAVADWFEVHQDHLELSIRNACNQMSRPKKDWDTLSEFQLWFKEDSNKPIETLIKMKTGYDIKSLPTYLVTFKENGILGYFSCFAANGSLVPVGDTYISDKTARFTDKEKALALATLIDGNVEEREHGINIGKLDSTPAWIQNKFFNSRELKTSKSKFNKDTFF